MDTEPAQIQQTAAAQIFNHRKVILMAQFHQIRQGRRLAEANDPVIAGMYLHQRFGAVVDCLFVVTQMGFVGGSYFFQLGAAAFHDFRNPEGAADFHQLSPGDDDLSALGQGRQHQEDGCSIVIHHQCALRAGEAAEDALHMAVAAAPFAGIQIEFQVE